MLFLVGRLTSKARFNVHKIMVYSKQQQAKDNKYYG